MPPNLRLFRLNIHTAAGIGRRFPYRVAEWQLAGAMFISGFILLRSGTTFDLPPYAAIRDIATETTWGWAFLLIGTLRCVVLIINGSRPRGSAHCRAALSIICAGFWVFLIAGHLALDTPTLMTGMLGGAIVTEFVNVFRAAGDAREAEEKAALNKTEGTGDGNGG